MHVFFQPDFSSGTIQLNEEESKHCVRVLRLKKGDEVHLADGKGTQGIAVITDDHPKKCILEIRERIVHQPSAKYYLDILVSPTKNMERIEWFLEKATEAGISKISFVETTNSERARVNIERCEKIMVSAMKQSKQWFLPQLHTLTKLPDMLPTVAGDLKLIAWCETPGTNLMVTHLKNCTMNNPHVTILIGPEGDFTEAETILAREHGFTPVSLGESILRTETAALYACMAVKTIFN